MNFFKRYFKCIWQRRLFLIVFLLFGLGIACAAVYSFYNPTHEVYTIKFSYGNEEIDLSKLKTKDYNKVVKTEIQDIRLNDEYIVLDDYRYMEASTYRVENYTDDKGYDHFRIFNGDVKIDDQYGVFDSISEDGYILIDDWYYYTRGLYKIKYVNNKLKLTNKETNEETVITAKWNKKYEYKYSSFEYVKVKGLTKSVSYSVDDEGIINLSVERRYFNSWQQARRFMMRMANNLSSTKASFVKTDGSMSTSDSSTKQANSIVVSSGGVNMLPYAFIGAGSGLLLGLLILVVLVIVKKEKAIDTLHYDNDTIYKYPFHLSLYKKSIDELKTLKKVVLLAMLFAMMQVVRLIPLPSGFGNLGISLSTFFFAIIGMLYGPSIGFIVGAVSDIFGFFVFPDGYPFHLGYTLQAALSGFTYGICFYKTKVNFSKCLFARLIINIFLNAVLGSIFWGDVADLSRSATFTYFLTLSLPKNIAYLIPQSLLIYLVFKALAPAFKSLNLVEPEICDDISKFEFDIKISKEDNNNCNDTNNVV